jgi:NADPH2:quinone reductase
MVRNDHELVELLVAGRATPLIGATFGLDESAEALRHVAEGRAVGKVVVQVAPA